MYFLIQPEDFTNTEYYLPVELYAPKTTGVKRVASTGGRKVVKPLQSAKVNVVWCEIE